MRNSRIVFALLTERTLVLQGRVLDVHDGDTIKVQLDSGPISVRLHGIDAPERNQPHGEESTAALARLVGGKSVDLEPVGQKSYGRLVAIVYVGSINANKRMIEGGEAWAARKYLRKERDAHWCMDENAARAAKRGIWSQPPEQWIDPREWFHREEGQMKFTDYSHENTFRCLAAIGGTS
jgi:endonuclease YncB( thermonuclease family)